MEDGRTLMKWKSNRVGRVLSIVLIFVLSACLCRAEDTPGLKGEKEKESYSLGYEFGSTLKRRPLDLDLAVIVEGIRDALEGKGPKLTAEEMKEIIAGMKRKVWTKQQKLYQEMLARNLKEGEAFLAENAKKEGVKTLSSGLQYRVLREGTGPSPKATDRVTVHYRGTLVDGTEFDDSYRRNEPSTVRIFGVIQGWTEALQLMKTGAKWQIFVPAKLGYGERRHGRIPPNSVLIFELELLSIHEGPFPTNAQPEHEHNGVLIPPADLTDRQKPPEESPGVEKD
jgi:FKBP-type peptidyl-prolyl cis-trans isomerase FklB